MNRREVLGLLGLGLLGTANQASGERVGIDVGADSPRARTRGTTGSIIGIEEAVIGEVITGNGVAFVVRNPRKTRALGRRQAEPGRAFLVVPVAIKNVTTEAFVLFDFERQSRVKDGQGFNYESTFVTTEQELVDAELAPGEVMRGDTVYEIAEDATDFTLEVDLPTATFGDLDRIVIDLETEAPTPADLEQTLDVDIHEPGTAVSTGAFRVSLNSVEFRRTVGDDTATESGFEFAIVDITTRNESEAVGNLSLSLQTLVKDGTGRGSRDSIRGTSELPRGYDQLSPLAPGESRRGLVAYTVPAEVEPLYWIFDATYLEPGSRALWLLRGEEDEGGEECEFDPLQSPDCP